MFRSICGMLLLAALILAAGPSLADKGFNITVFPTQISPNGDGVRDEATVTINARASTTVTITVRNSSGKTVSTLAEDFPLDIRQIDMDWDGSCGMGACTDGKYTIEAVFSDREKTKSTATVVVDTSHKWPPLHFTNKPFFPIGAWFEGSPQSAGYRNNPAGAKAYYDRAFADVAAHGFNTIAVPNCPAALSATLLESAERRHIKVILEIGSLAALVRAPSITESQVYAEAKSVHDKLGKYTSLIRYQIQDEPTPAMVPNWLLVQRILAAVDPARPAFSCFCSPDALSNVASKTTLTEAAFDIYTISVATPAQSLGGFVGTLDAFRQASDSLPAWAVLQAFAKPNAFRYPSPEELRAMTYLSLAAGAKGVFYFIYQTMPTHPEKLEGLVDTQGVPAAEYAPVSALALELGKLAPLVMSLKKADVQVRAEGGIKVGSFVDDHGSRVLILASSYPEKATAARLTVGGDAAWRDALSGETFVPHDGVVEAPLLPGAGRVLVEGGSLRPRANGVASISHSNGT